jgi:hypothetical protein
VRVRVSRRRRVREGRVKRSRWWLRRRRMSWRVWGTERTAVRVLAEKGEFDCRISRLRSTFLYISDTFTLFSLAV